jgi:hypothetical protein
LNGGERDFFGDVPFWIKCFGDIVGYDSRFAGRNNDVRIGCAAAIFGRKVFSLVES